MYSCYGYIWGLQHATVVSLSRVKFFGFVTETLFVVYEEDTECLNITSVNFTLHRILLYGGRDIDLEGAKL